MKTLFALVALTISAFSLTTPSFAANGAVYCKERGRVVNALAEEDAPAGCAGALMQGDACFTGSRAAVIELINDGAFNWDEEWLEKAHFKGADEIAYTFRDGPNELSDKLSLVRCPRGFFGR